MTEYIPEILKDFVIESDIPIPQRGVIPELAMFLKVGRSVKLESFKKVANLQNALRRRGRRGTARKYNGFYRVWRTE